MNDRSRRIGASTAVLCLAVPLLSACAWLGERTRPVLYPPDFEYIEQDKLESTMWLLASQVTTLDSLLDSEDPVPRDQVVSLLKGIERSANQLDTGGRPTNHPLLTQRLPGFLHTVRRARRAAEATPPRYFQAGTVSGACMSCHAKRSE